MTLPHRRTDNVKSLLVIVSTALLSLLVFLHTPGMNGPSYFQWGWRRLPGLLLYPLCAAAAVPFFLGQWIYLRQRRVAPALALVMTSCIFMQLAAICVDRAISDNSQSISLSRIPEIVQSQMATGYFNDAQDLYRSGDVRAFLADFGNRMPTLRYHARFREPGLILYHLAWIKLLGPGSRTAMIDGLSFAAWAAIAVWLTYLFVAKISNSTQAAFAAASSLALCPSLVLFFPEGDQLNPVFSCAMLITWVAATQAQSHSRRLAWSITFGAIFAVATLCAYNVLVIGLFVYGYALFASNPPPGWRALALQSLVGALSAATLYALLWLATGFNPITTFIAAWHGVRGEVHNLDRNTYFTMLFDLTDFAMGAGWIVVLPALCALGSETHRRRLVVVCFIQLLAIALLRIQPAETARVWMSMTPLLMLAAALDLHKWPINSRMTFYACLWLITVTICRNLRFIT